MSQEPTEEQMRAYVEQLRQAEPSELVVQAYTMLGTGAEVKLGRQDARVLIDAMAGLVQAAGRSLPEELSTQLAQGIAQLQMAQVQAEQHLAGDGGAPAEAGAAVDQPGGTPAPGSPGGTAPGDTAPGGTAPASRPAASQPAAPNPADRLWIPGRDPGPRR